VRRPRKGDSSMEKKTQAPQQSEMAIDALIAAIHADGDRRSEVRYPFFRPLSIHMQGHRFSAFGREISASGIGMLHNFDLAPQEVELDINAAPGKTIRMRTRISWCRSCGEGWYISAGEFVGANSNNTEN